MVAKDGAGRPRAVIETVSLYQKRFEDMDLEFALAEGEADSLEDWAQDHRAYFTRNGGFASDMMLWCERFRLIEVLSEGTQA